MGDAGTGTGAGGWPGAAWELLLPAAGAPVRRRGQVLQAAFREAVRSGRLAAGTLLPSSRELARDLGVSRGLVTEAYGQLLAEGYLTSRPGAGTWVAELPARRERTAAPGREAAPRAAAVDFRPGLADLSAFPRAAWKGAVRDALDRLPHTALDYPDPQGLPELREALAELLARRRGVAVAPEGLVVCSGVAQALTLLGRVLHARGHRSVALEDPGSPGEVSLFGAAGLRCVPLPVGDGGPDLEALARSGARAAVVTPAHQFPLGAALGPAQRAALLGWARGCGGLVVEDDYDGDFRYDRAPVGALQGLDPGLVAYTGSVSKSLAPGLRLGWLVPPPGLLAEVVEAKRVADLGNAVPEQAAFAGFVRSGRYDRQLRLCQRRYRQRRDALTGALGRHLPDVRVSGVAAGLHLVAAFPERYGTQREVTGAAARAGVRLRPLDDWRLPVPQPSPGGGTGPARFVLGYPHLAPAEIEGAVAAVAEALRGRSGR
ncbi:PLP-dependent aminotransferase family protein [Streptacidiphilus sp. ASG 303]|uniref:MocR-like pyridoxine biosynthesis transcription factor PdxR n=1 Tax=Streptacidiphilus sp. ASG 303 TaxID=2896847 RepID=UPI001E44511D|nr:PLP-dependent aminotransferase family protein [Streptacidiphilus sp. ASG 303]MCD0480975.1 PLP-dependent aminotransferase family protein [Streptacidiphilus sp. ASG 303]